MKSPSRLELDPIDRKILCALQEDGTRSAAQIAALVNMTATTCWRRIVQLEKEGVLGRRVALVNRTAVGLNVVVFAHVKLLTQGRDALAKFEAAIRECPEVLACYTIMGEWDFLLHIVATDIAAYESFYLDYLSRIPVVQSVSSSMVMTVIKESTALPIHSEPRGRVRQR